MLDMRKIKPSRFKYATIGEWNPAIDPYTLTSELMFSTDNLPLDL